MEDVDDGTEEKFNFITKMAHIKRLNDPSSQLYLLDRTIVRAHIYFAQKFILLSFYYRLI